MPVLVEQLWSWVTRTMGARPPSYGGSSRRRSKNTTIIQAQWRSSSRRTKQLPLDQVFADWAVGIDPSVHIDKINELFDRGPTIVNIHSAQPEQRTVIAFYAERVLPNGRSRS